MIKYCEPNCSCHYDVSVSACRAIVSEIEHNVSKVDPKKTIEVGSFRVDPNGKTRTIQVGGFT